ncbi:hypothetical protein amad1_07690 [Alteromonas mediterranea DE1]|nr:hypothetical protein amad1_07690 [Alteromonas mediterranea DE1]AGP81421.1 hypothetical protein I533_07225 [Alteromonas mediterranea MED64]AGP97060.1 hypothetical protein I635_07680 [Alteromonas mediterranea UM7]AGQ01408.1 hypothetical protein I636_07770 [Alteromonas mediterranea UM4b]
MSGIFIFGAWITQTHDKADISQEDYSSEAASSPSSSVSAALGAGLTVTTARS